MKAKSSLHRRRKPTDRQVKICLTGGIACGKSLLSEYLNALGVETLDADEIVHELIPDPQERKRIAAEVFNNPTKRKELEDRLHPLVKERLMRWVEEAGEDVIRVAVVPLLFEVGWEGEFDLVACVASPREMQIERMVANRGYSRKEAELRMAAQLPVAEKAAKSDYVINNDSSSEELRKETERFVSWLKNSMCSRIQ